MLWKKEFYAMAKSITWPESDWACISLAEGQTEGKMPQEQAGTEDCIVSWLDRSVDIKFSKRI